MKKFIFFLENDIFASAFIIIPPLVKVIELLKEKRKKMVRRCKHFDHLNNICYSMVEDAVNISHGVLQKQ